MISENPRQTHWTHALLIMIVLAAVWLSTFETPYVMAKSGVRTIRIEFFWSKDCPHCESAKALVTDLKRTQHIEVREFDIDNEADYAAFHRLEATYNRSNLTVPLIIVGKDLLVGESEIKTHLETRIRTFTERSTKEAQKDNSPKKAPKKSHSTGALTKDKAKPSRDSVREEWGRMKITIDEFF